MSTAVIDGTRSGWRNLIRSRFASVNNARRIKHELKLLGMSNNDLWQSGSAYLSRSLETYEVIQGIVYEYHDAGSTLLVATDWRLVFLKQEPLYISEDDISYDEIDGVSYTRFGDQLTVVVHTKARDYMVRTTAHAGAEALLAYIEKRTLKIRNELNVMERV